MDGGGRQNGPMPLFSRNEPASLSDYRRVQPHPGHLLAWASGPRVELLAFTDHLAVQRGQQWQRIGWHEVRTGGWKSESDELHWRLLDGSTERLALTEPGRVPEVFRERVNASIVLDETFPVPSGGAVLVSARRDLGNPEPRLLWSATSVQGARMSDPEVSDLATRALGLLRADYDL